MIYKIKQRKGDTWSISRQPSWRWWPKGWWFKFTDSVYCLSDALRFIADQEK